jgi:NAD(P)-dependent dehydrogenase (short-subunit alcohol dehydrogenase family)
LRAWGTTCCVSTGLETALPCWYGVEAMLLKDKVALITGGGRGIGAAMAKLFAQEGASVFVCSRSETELQVTTEAVRAAGGKADYVTANLMREGDCGRAVESARAAFGRIDILVNNAGNYGPVMPVEEYPVADFDKVIAVHLRAAFILTKSVLPEMYARQSGVILNISSLSAKSAFPWGSGYAAAKAGLLALTRVTSAEAARKGVRVNAICPGPVTETVMSKQLGNTLAEKLGVTPEEQLKGFLSTILQGRGQTTMEIAHAALFLCSEKSSAIVGQAINVDGGAAFF